MASDRGAKPGNARCVGGADRWILEVRLKVLARRYAELDPALDEVARARVPAAARLHSEGNQ